MTLDELLNDPSLGGEDLLRLNERESQVESNVVKQAVTAKEHMATSQGAAPAVMKQTKHRKQEQKQEQKQKQKQKQKKQRNFKEFELDELLGDMQEKPAGAEQPADLSDAKVLVDNLLGHGDELRDPKYEDMSLDELLALDDPTPALKPSRTPDGRKALEEAQRASRRQQQTTRPKAPQARPAPAPDMQQPKPLKQGKRRPPVQQKPIRTASITNIESTSTVNREIARDRHTPNAGQERPRVQVHYEEEMTLDEL